jgi:hypothetical protein
MPVIQHTFHLFGEESKKLRNAAKKRNLSQSAVLRELISTHL